MATKWELNQFFERLGELYDGCDVSESWMHVWLKNFEHCPVEVLYRALDRHVQDSRFKPQLSDIYKHALAIYGRHFRPQPKDDSTKFQEEWFKAQHNAGRVPCWTGSESDYPNGTFRGWRPRSEAVFHNGSWKPTIEFLMDVLGAQAVADELRGHFAARVPSGRPLTVLLEISKHLATETGRKDYRDKIESLKAQALYFTKTKPAEEINF